MHPGGPYWQHKDAGSWSVPKGEVDEGGDLLATARREFEEETGLRPDGKFVPLAPLKQASGKLVHAWALEGDIDTSSVRSNSFTIEWPPRSGQRQEFPEVDRGEWLAIAIARDKILPGQRGFLDELQAWIDDPARRRPK